MLTIKTFAFNMVQVNTYVLHDETKEAVIIDCGAFFSEEQEVLAAYINENDLTVKHLIDTHGHFDHIMGNGFAFHHFGLRPLMHAEDESVYLNSGSLISRLMRRELNIETPAIGQYIAEGDAISFGTHRLQVLHTPGHTRGGVTLYCAEEHCAFCGDCVFLEEIGRTDLEGGDYNTLIQAIKTKIMTLPDDTVLYSGHGPTTTVGHEKRHNRYLQ